MRKKTLVLSLLLACATAFGQSSYDLVIVGGNPGGIMAAISAARMGEKIGNTRTYPLCRRTSRQRTRSNRHRHPCRNDRLVP